MSCCTGFKITDMQRLLILPVLFLLSSMFSRAEEVYKRIPGFMVISSEKDPSIKNGKAVFEFEIMNEELKQYADQLSPIQGSCNGESFDFSLPKNGIYTKMVFEGKYIFQFYTNGYYEIYSDSVTIKQGYRTKVQLRFDYSESEIISDKPVIYLYPTTNLEVTTTVNPNGKFLFTYPTYENGWKGTAHPDGSITIADKNYPYLFWEGSHKMTAADMDLTKGYMVKGDSITAFLEKNLAKMGLNDREMTDFITYWGPRMTGNDQQFVQFIFNDECNQFADLSISPPPAQIFRVYMIWVPVPEGVVMHPEPQEIKTVKRDQFYAIEWGGSEITYTETLVNHE
ncbi:MAG: hypothetical protein A3D31_03470 [Candidatus Fluviicola riflensis]|nr:MAG: hypothetical protein CHH17_11560 [Candidatus Fluviicola riflensis]OGS79038.1 MAG: hypothetical protein A3D31_03470 [Candidatus Fluviicola riflensis]OGS86061.1 MAG: hypothetical protein A3E30_10960 [Fluviicola sp. RIFCSPHIGHO2_12_FULL_43_24]OGS86470.1 MAG: hypothetical protein A2724_02930 [Fluviicola sp. RIFCSPHIGHO2_01_FULL_43_53]